MGTPKGRKSWICCCCDGKETSYFLYCITFWRLQPLFYFVGYNLLGSSYSHLHRFFGGYNLQEAPTSMFSASYNFLETSYFHFNKVQFFFSSYNLKGGHNWLIYKRNNVLVYLLFVSIQSYVSILVITTYIWPLLMISTSHLFLFLFLFLPGKTRNMSHHISIKSLTLPNYSVFEMHIIL